jgi:hypothetical protein
MHLMLRLFNLFLVRSRWVVFIQEEDIIGLWVVGDGPSLKVVLNNVIEATIVKYERISEQPMKGNVMLRRWIMSVV